MTQKNKGMLLEKIINQTISFYEKNELAFIEKKSIPVKFSGVANDGIKLENASFKGKSTVDYIGCYKGYFVAFEAKSVEGDVFHYKNISSHQLKYLKKIMQNGGCSFLIIFFNHYDSFFLVKTIDLLKWGKKSIKFNEMSEIGFRMDLIFPGIIDFLPFLNNLF